MNATSLRRAAILIASLDTASADALLDEMSPEQAALVRHAVMELGDVDDAEQQTVIAQFLGRAPRPAVTSHAGVEVDAELASKFGTSPIASPPPTVCHSRQPENRPSESPAFAFLDSVDPRQLAGKLAGEHPQTTAIIVAHLTPPRAAEVLRHLPRSRQAETLRRIARLDTPHPDVIRDLQHELRALVDHQQPAERVAAAGLATIEAILRYTSPEETQELVTELAQQDQALVQRLLSAPGKDAATAAPVAMVKSTTSVGDEQQRVADPHAAHGGTLDISRRQALQFSELEQLDSAALAQVFHHCSVNTMLLALAGATPRFLKHILSHLPSREARQLNRKIEQIGPLRLDDVQRAQQQVATIAQQLIEEGALTLPETQRLSVAA